VPAHPVTRLALRLLALTAVRPGEVRGAAWPEFECLDGPEPLWRVPAERMKMRRDHLVPLS
jgi:integrase